MLSILDRTFVRFFTMSSVLGVPLYCGRSLNFMGEFLQTWGKKWEFLVVQAEHSAGLLLVHLVNMNLLDLFV